MKEKKMRLLMVFLIVVVLLCSSAGAENDGKIISIHTEPDLLVSGQSVSHEITVKNTGTKSLDYQLEIFRGSYTSYIYMKEFSLGAGETKTLTYTATMGEPGPRTYTYYLEIDWTWPNSNELLDKVVEIERCFSLEEVSDNDHDNLLYYMEVEELGTDPNNPDTDGDGKRDDVDEKPTIAEGSISIISNPSGASVYLDGAYMGKTPLSLDNVISKSHIITVKKTGYDDKTLSLSLSAGGAENLDVLLESLSGSISISSNPSGANIYLDGTFKGTTPTTLSNVPTGSHAIKIAKSGYNDISKSVTVSSSQTTYISENLESIIISHPTAAVTEEQTSSPTYNKGISYEKNNTTLPIIFVFTILTLIFIIKIRKKSANPASYSNSPPPSKTTSPTPTPVAIQKLKDKGTIDIKSAFQYNGATIQYKVKIINHTLEPLSDIKIQLFVPDVFMLTKKEKSIPMLEPKESKTVTFDIRPTGECGDCAVSGRMNYYDYGTKKRQDVDIKKKMISIVCPVLKRKEIDEDGWRKATEELIKAEENTKDLDIPAENLFNIATRVLKDMSMYMIPPEITSTPQLFTGVSMFYADGAAGLRYAAYIEVVGGRKSRMILKAWAEKEEALTGFYHKILDEIEKRLDIKVFIDEGIIQHHVHKTEIKDNIIQRSNIDLGSRAQCPNCGSEVEANEKFCNECGEKL
jgi:hypothetical protein